MDRQDTINAQNRIFWDEPCGNNAFQAIGLEEYSVESLKKYDDWYMGFYPYLYTHVPFAELKGKKVLEVGLGMGTLSQKLAEAGAIYHGLDIAAKPVALVNARLAQNGLPGSASEGNILDSGIPDSAYDFVVAIGCYQHTGNVQKAIDETWRILKSGGKAIIMVYNAYSYRQWLARPLETGKRMLGDLFGSYASPRQENEAMRRIYDHSTSGDAAAETVLISRNQFRRLTAKFSTVHIRAENINAINKVFRHLGRDRACRMFGPMLGLDLYCACVK